MTNTKIVFSIRAIREPWYFGNYLPNNKWLPPL